MGTAITSSVQPGDARARQRLHAEPGLQRAAVPVQEVLGREVAPGAGRSRQAPSRIPLALTPAEVAAILDQLKGARLTASLMYGAGLRLLECCRLRVKGRDFARREITA
jgi:integrase